MEKYLDFIALIEEFIRLFESLTAIEQKKLDSAIENKITFVEECMNKEQALILRLRGLEQRREKLQHTLGLDNLTFRQIIEQAPPDAAGELKPLFDRLSRQVRDFQAVNESAKDVIALNLHKLQQTAKNADTAGAPYAPPGKKASADTHFTNRFV